MMRLGNCGFLGRSFVRSLLGAISVAQERAKAEGEAAAAAARARADMEKFMYDVLQ